MLYTSYMSLVILDQLVRAYNLWSFSMKWQVSRSKKDDKKICLRAGLLSILSDYSCVPRTSVVDARPCAPEGMQNCKIPANDLWQLRRYRQVGGVECAKIAGRLAQLRRLSPTYNWWLNVAIRTIFRAHTSHALNRARKVGEFKLPHNGKGIIPFAGIL